MLLLTTAISLACPVSVRQDNDAFQDRTLKIGSSEFHFRVFTPNGWSKKKKSPVILFLHGAGERGDDNLIQTKIGIGPAILRQRDSFPFIVVLPQCPKGRWWTEGDMQSLALKALEQTMKELNGDSTRTYLTGLSMGGYGSWLMASTNPARFAALAIVCGGVVPPRGLTLPKEAILPESGDPYAAVASRVRKVPVWVFHGNADPAVPVSESRKMVEAIKSAGGDVRYNEYEGVGHNSWDKAYSEADLFPWLLSHRAKQKG
jgi:predicted peptidase